MSKQEIKLEYPIECSGQVRKSLTMRRPKLRDFEAVDNVINDIEKSVRLIANLTELSPDEVRELDMVDFRRVNEVLEGFLGQKS